MESPPYDSLTISLNDDENIAVEEDADEFLISNGEDQTGEEEKKEENTNIAPIVDEINYDVLDVFQHPMICERLAAWADLTRNPHCKQVEHNNEYYSPTDINFSRVLQANAPRMKYRRRREEVKTVIHWGQRKLLLSEIEFLTLHALPGTTVIYAGAAPGTHIEYLSNMFPDVNFVLVDPAPFTVKERLPQITLRANTLFTDELAQELGALYQDILFISDIRSADPTVLTEDETEQQVAKDMSNQSQWHKLMGARKSMLKFRLSWRAGKTKYLAGEINLPVWGPVTTTESRLIVDFNAPEVEYDNTEYEERMFHFNTVTRVGRYRHNIRGEGIDHCYDCTAEISILRAYLTKRKGITETDPTLNEQIARMSRQISRKISAHRKLSSPNPDPEQRKRVIMKRQYINGKPAYLSENHGHQAEHCHFENKKRSQRKRRTFNAKKFDLNLIKMNIMQLNNLNNINATNNAIGNPQNPADPSNQNLNITGDYINQTRVNSDQDNNNNNNVNNYDPDESSSEAELSVPNTTDNKRKRADSAQANQSDNHGSEFKRPKHSHSGD